MALLPEDNGEGGAAITTTNNDGEGVSITNFALPGEDGQRPSVGNGEAAITTTSDPPVPTLYNGLGIIDKAWKAMKYSDASGNLVDVVPVGAITLKLENSERFEGFSGCNNYSGSYTDATSTSISIGPIASTLMICDSEEINQQETSYLANLNGVINWSTSEDGTGLELTNEDGDVLAQYLSEDVMTILTIPLDGGAEDSVKPVLSADDQQGNSGAFASFGISASLAAVAIVGLVI